MSRASGNGGEARMTGQGSGATKNHSADPDVGRVEVAHPKQGELQVYRKADGLMGARVFCEEDGGKYGVSPNVRKQFPNPGTYRGLAYVDERRGLVFRFKAGGTEAADDALHSINAAFGRVYVPRSFVLGRDLEHGTLVAFHWRLENGNGNGKARRVVEKLLPLDGDHLSLIAALIADGKLAFPAHAGASMCSSGAWRPAALLHRTPLGSGRPSTGSPAIRASRATSRCLFELSAQADVVRA